MEAVVTRGLELARLIPAYSRLIPKCRWRRDLAVVDPETGARFTVKK